MTYFLILLGCAFVKRRKHKYTPMTRAGARNNNHDAREPNEATPIVLWNTL